MYLIIQCKFIFMQKNVFVHSDYVLTQQMQGSGRKTDLDHLQISLTLLMAYFGIEENLFVLGHCELEILQIIVCLYNL
jgi:hypothetical protein